MAGFSGLAFLLRPFLYGFFLLIGFFAHGLVGYNAHCSIIIGALLLSRHR